MYIFVLERGWNRKTEVESKSTEALEAVRSQQLREETSEGELFKRRKEGWWGEWV